MPTVLITGAASGIGRAAAARFAASGWRCVLVDRNGEALAHVHNQIEALSACTAPPSQAAADGRHETRCIDLTDPEQIRSLADLAGPVDAVINNAGMSDSSGTPLIEQTPERQAVLAALNLAAPAAVVAALEPKLAPRARIVNVASGAGLRAIPFRGYYSATKAGLIAQSLALARARPGLVVTVLCPGFVRTELVDSLIATGRLDPRQAVAKTPLGRMAEPVEMAEMMRFLASPAAEVIRGRVVPLCGGSSVYGGSRACEPATTPPLPMDTPLSVTLAGDATGMWSDLAQARAGTTAESAAVEFAAAYPAVVDASALGLPQRDATGIVAAVHEAARGFAARHARDASLTLLLPALPGTADGADRGRPSGDSQAVWQTAGDAAAARMLVATLACELAARALRVNAVEVMPGLRPERLKPLLHFIAGARAQFLTGQTLRTAED